MGMDIIHKAKTVHKLLGRNHERDVYVKALQSEFEIVNTDVPFLYYKDKSLGKSTIDFIVDNDAVKIAIVKDKDSLLSNSELFKNELKNISTRHDIKKGFLIIFFHSTYDEDVDPDECFTQVIIVDV